MALLAPQAQQPNWVRRIGVPMDYAETDPTALPFLAAFTQGLATLGSSEGNNLYVDMDHRRRNTHSKPHLVETRQGCSDPILDELLLAVPRIICRAVSFVGSALRPLQRISCSESWPFRIQ